MLDLLAFIIKLILAGVFSGLCRYRQTGESIGKDVIRTSLIGVTAAATIVLSGSIFDEQTPTVLIGVGMLVSIVLVYVLIKEDNRSIGVRDIFALQIGWFTGVGKIGYALVMLIFLIVIYNQLTSLENTSDLAHNQEIDSN